MEQSRHCARHLTLARTSSRTSLPTFPKRRRSINSITNSKWRHRLASRRKTELAYAATRGMLNAVHDSHVSFMTPAEYRERESQLSGKPGFSGIGIIIRSPKSDDAAVAIFVDEVIAGSPAAK